MAAKKTTTKKTTKGTRAPKPRAAKPDLAGAPVQGSFTPTAPESVSAPANDNIGIDKSVQKAHREFAAAMNKDGRRLVAMADEAPNVYELRRPTGIMPLDIDIGGGFPAGGLSIVSGPDNVGKTYIVLRAMVMNQRLRGDKSSLAIAIAEGAFDYKRALQAGLLIAVPDEIIAEWNQERINLHMSPYTEADWKWFKRQIGGFQILRGHTGEELMHIVLEAVKANMFDIVGVDSLSVLLPEADEDKDVGERGARAGNANLMTDFIKKYTPYTSGLTGSNATTVIGIMQVRANNAKADAGHLAKYLKDWAVTGAYAIRHGKLVDITIWDGSVLKKNVHGAVKVYGKVLHWKIEKGKAGCHDNVQGETEYRYDLPSGHDDISSIVVSGVSRGVFVEERGKVEIYHPITRAKTDLGGFPSYPALSRVMAEDFEFELQMRLYVLAAFGVQCLYRQLA